jgi:two-component system, NtrC family, response regulator AtoC
MRAMRDGDRTLRRAERQHDEKDQNAEAGDDRGREVTVLTLGGRQVLIADPAMVDVFRLLRRLAVTDLPVLIAGETGVGKENAAHALHAWSTRADRPFVAINCAALTPSLIESELFGHERGAFSGALARKAGLLESAQGGTVLLDEIGELRPTLQAKLLRVIETRRVMPVGSVHEHAIDVRVVAASNRDLGADVEGGRFRRDLLYRICGTTVTLPPLRERRGEIPLLAHLFLEQAQAAAGRAPVTLSRSTIDQLHRHDWPGNVRELEHEMGRVAALVDGHLVEPYHLSAAIQGLGGPSVRWQPPPARRLFVPLADELRALERQRMLSALAAAGYVQKRAAELIGMPVRTFRTKAKRYLISWLAR